MKKSLFLLTAVAVTLFSCEKEQDIVTENPDLSGKTVTVKASHEVDAEVKTTVDGLGNVEWETTDKLSFVYDGGSAESNAAGVTGTSAEFTATLPGGKEALYLVYPSSVTAVYESSSLKVTVPATQDGTFASAAIEVAEFAASCDLKNLGAILAITTTADVDEIVISSNNSTPLAGKATVAFAAGIPSVDAVASGSTSVTLSGLGGAGTYYAAVLPDSYAAGIYVELKKSGSVVGEKISGNSLTVARRKIMRINVGNPGTIGNKRFVTVAGAGLTDGTSWENAMSSDDFYAFLTLKSTNTSVFMAAGTYPTQATAGYTINTGTTGLKVYGGYPTGATGTSLAGRDITTNRTILSGDQNGDGSVKNRIFVANGASITATFDGLEFRDAYRASGGGDIGSAIIINKCKTVNFYNCTISDNESAVAGASYGGGAVRAVAGTILFKGCTFSNNVSASKGGAIRMGVGSNVTLDACVFSNNSAVYGGAIHVGKGTLNVINGTQFNNNETTEKTGGAISIIAEEDCTVNISNSVFFHNRAIYNSYCGGAMYITGQTISETTYKPDVTLTNCTFEENLGHTTDLATAELKSGLISGNVSTGGAIFLLEKATVKVDRCRFYHNACSQSGGAIRVRNATAVLMLNRCIFDRNYAAKGGSAIENTSGIIAMHNCVLYSNSNNVGASSDATISVGGGECLVANTSLTIQSSYPGILCTTTANSILVNNILKNVTSGKPAVSVADGYTVSSYGHNIWSVLGGTGTVDNTNNDPSTDVVASASWSWVDPNLVVTTLPAAFYKSGVVDNRATVSNVEAAIDDFDDANGTGFKTWLTSVDANALMVDITGYTRAVNKTTDKITPGSYQIR